MTNALLLTIATVVVMIGYCMNIEENGEKQRRKDAQQTAALVEIPAFVFNPKED
jgi:hypothetical protein